MIDRRYLAEALGTFVLVLAGTGAIVLDDGTGGALGGLGVAVAFGLAVWAMILAFGRLSGAHINPAVTVGLWIAHRIPGRWVAPYVASQCIGALAASVLLATVAPSHERLGATVPARDVTIVFAVEVVLTCLLVHVILHVSSRGRPFSIGTIAAVVGGVVGLAAWTCGPISGASMNPARSLGPAVASGELTHLWLYVVAPALGAALAVPGCRLLRPRGCCERAVA